LHNFYQYFTGSPNLSGVKQNKTRVCNKRRKDIAYKKPAVANRIKDYAEVLWDSLKEKGHFAL